MKKRDLISIQDLSTKEIFYLFDLAARLKKTKSLRAMPLQGKSIGLLFQKPSNRTRVSFEVGISQLGGNCIYLSPEEIDLGKRESTRDVAMTLCRYLDGLIARTHSHQDVVDLARYASIPVINGLSDLSHPCQGLADLFSVKERFGKFKGIALAYVGDGNNVCHSLMLGASKVGLQMRIATPNGYEPRADIGEAAKGFAKTSGAKITLSHSPEEAVQGVQVIYADVWVSMGQEAEYEKRLKDFEGFQINAGLLKKADKDYIFMHCLPAHRGQEVTDQVVDGPHSIIFDQAENRLHVQKAVLMFLMGDG